MCKSSAPGPSQAELNLMNAQAEQIRQQQEIMAQQEAEAAAQRKRRQEEIAAEKAADIRKQSAERESRKRISSTATMFSGTSLLNQASMGGGLMRRTGS